MKVVISIQHIFECFLFCQVGTRAHQLTPPTQHESCAGLWRGPSTWNPAPNTSEKRGPIAVTRCCIWAPSGLTSPLWSWTCQKVGTTFTGKQFGHFSTSIGTTWMKPTGSWKQTMTHLLLSRICGTRCPNLTQSGQCTWAEGLPPSLVRGTWVAELVMYSVKKHWGGLSKALIRGNVITSPR